MEKEDIFNMFMGVFLFAINKLGYNQIENLNENKKYLWVEKKIKRELMIPLTLSYINLNNHIIIISMDS